MHDTSALDISLRPEYEIDSSTMEQIRELLGLSFEEFEYARRRSYFKQIPPQRVIGTRGGRVVAQCGLEHRAIGCEGRPYEIFGVVDLCVDPSVRGQGIASTMLRWIEKLAQSATIDFIVLFADDSRLYEANGYEHRSNRLHWLKIHEHKSYGMADEAVPELMVLEINDNRPWPEGDIDMLGYLF